MKEKLVLFLKKALTFFLAIYFTSTFFLNWDVFFHGIPFSHFQWIQKSQNLTIWVVMSLMMGMLALRSNKFLVEKRN